MRRKGAIITLIMSSHLSPTVEPQNVDYEIRTPLINSTLSLVMKKGHLDNQDTLTWPAKCLHLGVPLYSPILLHA